MTTINSPRKPAVDLTPTDSSTDSPLLPDPTNTTIDDATLNDELYQQFLKQEAALDGTQDTELPADEDGEDSDAGSGEGGSVAPSAPSPDADTPPASGEPVEPVIEQKFLYNGHEYAPEEIERIFQAAQWVGQINPWQAEFIDRVLSGEIDLSTLQAPQAPHTPIIPPVAPVDDYEYADPRLKEELDALRSTVASLQSTTQSQLQATQAQTQAQILSEIEQGVQAYTPPFDLTPEERQFLVDSSVTAQVIPQLATTLPPREAIQKAMDYAFWNTPEFRDRAIEAKAAETQQAQIADITRKSKASALTSSGGSIPRNAPQPPLSSEQRRKAMASEIADSMSGN